LLCAGTLWTFAFAAVKTVGIILCPAPQSGVNTTDTPSALSMPVLATSSRYEVTTPASMYFIVPFSKYLSKPPVLTAKQSTRDINPLTSLAASSVN